MSDLTVLERILQELVNETDANNRTLIANKYLSELQGTLRAISGRSFSTLWSEKEDILEQIGDVNTIVSRLLEVLEAHNIESRRYREGQKVDQLSIIDELHKVNRRIDDITDERLIAQITNHEERITALENERSDDKSA